VLFYFKTLTIFVDMQDMSYKIIAGVCILFVGVLFYQNNADSTLPQIVYQLPEPSLWKRDTAIGTELAGPEHYYFNQTDNIDLNIVPIEDDLLDSLKTRGAQQFTQDIMSGKNHINTMFGAEDTKLISSELKSFNGAYILELRTEQKIEKLTLSVLEKYFIYKGQAVNFQLRWQNDSDVQNVKKAQLVFNKMTVQARSAASK
jgi:hypothetical protein